MATTSGVILKIPGQSGAWWWAGHGEIRFIPSGQGMGTFCQGLGWPQVNTDQTAIDELIDNFGQGADFA